MLKTPTRTNVLRLFVILLIAWIEEGGSMPTDAYRVLGVPRAATQPEIRRQYRKLCLKYHPDKNQGNPRKEKMEEMFKQVQEAYESIGTEDKRRVYDMQSKFRGHNSQQYRRSSSNSRPYGQRQSYRNQSQHKPPFGWDSNRRSPPNGFEDLSRMYEQFVRAYQRDAFKAFRDPPDPRFTYRATKQSPVFVQTIRVSLKDLYHGTSNVVIPPLRRVNLWTRLTAAQRGGMLFELVYKSFLASLPFLNRSQYLAIFFGGYFFYHSLPHPPRQSSSASINLPPGTRPGDTFITKDRVVKILWDKQHHHEYDDNDTISYHWHEDGLHATVTLTPRQATRGCFLSSSLIPKLRIPPRSTHGQTIRLVGKGWPSATRSDREYFPKGWPNNKEEERGDLVVHIKVQKRRRNKRR